MPENADRIRTAYAEFARTRVVPPEVLDPAVEWHTAEDLPDSGVHRGHEGVAALIREWTDSFETFAADVQELTERGRFVVVSVVLRGRLKGSSEEVVLPETHVWRVRDGLAVEVREYRTLEQALEAVSSEASPPGDRQQK